MCVLGCPGFDLTSPTFVSNSTSYPADLRKKKSIRCHISGDKGGGIIFSSSLGDNTTAYGPFDKSNTLDVFILLFY